MTSIRTLLACLIIFSSFHLAYAHVDTTILTLPEIKLPHTENTNFDNFPKPKSTPSYLSKTQIKRLGLEKWKEDNHAESIVLRYRLPKLEQAQEITAIVITYQKGDSELFTDILTFKQHKLIDSKTIAYDEIAESWLQQNSMIRHTHIEHTEISYVTEPRTITKTKYFITMNGIIKMVAD